MPKGSIPRCGRQVRERELKIPEQIAELIRQGTVIQINGGDKVVILTVGETAKGRLAFVVQFDGLSRRQFVPRHALPI